jgi:CCR4-NOT transcription complex subunit 6
MGGVNIKSIPPSSGLFSFTFLTCLYLNHNALTSVPPEIAKLRHLDLLDLSGNNLTSVPPEIGMVITLRELYLFDNHLSTIPPEFGTLHRLKTLGIEGNPIDSNLKAILQKDGTPALISYLRDSCPMPVPPPPRPLIQINPHEPGMETFKVISYNILCERAATAKMYGYTPTWALVWDYRKARILEEVTDSKADIVCLQEADMGQYEDFFSRRLAELGYEGVYGAKSRYKTMQDSDRRLVDGCATFFKKDRSVFLLDILARVYLASIGTSSWRVTSSSSTPSPCSGKTSRKQTTCSIACWARTTLPSSFSSRIWCQARG